MSIVPHADLSAKESWNGFLLIFLVIFRHSHLKEALQVSEDRVVVQVRFGTLPIGSLAADPYNYFHLTAHQHNKIVSASKILSRKCLFLKLFC